MATTEMTMVALPTLPHPVGSMDLDDYDPHDHREVKVPTTWVTNYSRVTWDKEVKKL